MVMGMIVLWRFSVTIISLWHIRFIVLTNGSAPCCIRIHTPHCVGHAVFPFLPVQVSLLDSDVMIPYPLSGTNDFAVCVLLVLPLRVFSVGLGVALFRN